MLLSLFLINEYEYSIDARVRAISSFLIMLFLVSELLERQGGWCMFSGFFVHVNIVQAIFDPRLLGHF